MDDGMAINVFDSVHDALLELLLRRYANVAQDRAGKLGEEAFDQVEPGPVCRCEGELEAAGWSSGEPSSGFSRDVSGMIIENQLDRGAERIGGIKKLEKFDKLSAAVAVSDQGMYLPSEQINPSQQAQVPWRLYS